MLYIGEKVGAGRAPRSTSRSIRSRAPRSPPRAGRTRSRCIAMAEEGGFLNAPDIYMDKIAVGGGLPDGVIDLDAAPAENLAQARRGQGRRGRRPHRLHPRPAAPRRADRRGARGRRAHQADPRRRRRRRDRDRAARHRHRHLHGHRAARPRACSRRRRCAAIGGQMQGRLLFRNDDERGRAAKHGHHRPRPRSTSSTTSPRATSCSPRPASPTARC